ncbi:CRISPR-associated endoribonuclease Cas6 [Candidatus Scalindua japonica]
MERKPELLQFAITAGLRSRNSSGFGFVEKVEKRKGIKEC